MARRLFLVSLLFASVSCGDGGAPTLSPIVAQQGVANEPMVVVLSASDPEGDRLTFGFASGLPQIDNRARIDRREGGRALFRYTPLFSDVGEHTIDLFVSDGQHEARQAVVFRIGAADGTTAPLFVKPLGTGTTLDLEAHDCVSFPVLIEDADSSEVTIGQEAPLLAGTELVQDSAQGGAFSFCPSKEQVAADDRYAVLLSADDHDNPKTLKDYLLVLRSGDGAGCPGDPPLVAHDPADVSSVHDITIVAEVSDDLGIKYEPLLYYSLTPPADPPDLGAMTQLTMSLGSGGEQSGSFRVEVPNPVASQPAGSSAQLYYLIVAKDNDDIAGTCDHLTQAPESGAYAITVENPGGSGGKGLCETCSADSQCGGPGDHCVFFGGSHHCSQGCAASSDCPGGYYCSPSQLTSVDAASARQCLPESSSCSLGGGGCVDDLFEENDTRGQSAAIGTGTHENLKSCPAASGDDEDWYTFTLSASAQVTATLSGTGATDLDLTLTDSAGIILDKSDSLSSNESVSTCLSPGSHHLHVFAYGSGENPYALTLSKTPSSCPSVCLDDENEPDDGASSARWVDLNLGAYSSIEQMVCSGDDDWFEVYMYAGETLHAALDFVQSSSSQDLDLYVYSASLMNLTGCSEQTPSACDPFNGQSGTSNETLSWPISSTGTHYLVVHGWNGAASPYDICVGLSSSDCP